ncbi:MAG: helix-turn-helix domain-containing protein [Acidobacteria bacterium]|nr:helix-turn-helix domain-containing protein [Acidobacteriota bacterium]
MNQSFESSLSGAEVARKTYTVREVSRILGIGRNTAYEAVKTGDIPSVTIGRRVLIPHCAVERLLTGAAAEKLAA